MLEKVADGSIPEHPHIVKLFSFQEHATRHADTLCGVRRGGEGGYPKKSRRVVLYADLPAEMLNVNPEVHTARMLKYLSRPR